ncbi:alpha-amylase family glycosyl hydrolase [Flammeovirga pacifica]|uniref:Glycosyl hydrolase family 13 catalytic domain-containing protein n=1 Tax=Flammeovirga pacifica TaxID=915059 RepID=A0A1S1YVK7_FLAPC|nr:alpha-amylase family glycosyl hydrolase [Flammeovirga pacifica]OHX65068.1 hypothetical protein NH26_01230 [Flammeovirga pacifica]
MIKKVEPPFWWNAFARKELQILLYGTNISRYTVNIEDNNVGVVLKNCIKTNNPNYLFLEILLPKNCPSGSFFIHLNDGAKYVEYEYHIYQSKLNPKYQIKETTITQQDAIYLIMPDRFAKGGDFTSKKLFEKENKKVPHARHGGDLQGILNKVDYINNLGCTTLWLTPIEENNAQSFSYHGYGITDFYSVDERLGDNHLYKKLSDKIHKKGMKLIKDVVLNHIGIEHNWLKDLPDTSWLNNQTYIEGDKMSYHGTNYHVNTAFDPYVSDEDLRATQEGWFTDQMPDLNQDHPLLATYLIQNTLWWIEYAQLDGLRIDTFGYVFPSFNNDWVKAIKLEFPALYIVAEILVGETPFAAKYGHYNTYNVSAVTDLPLAFTAVKSFRSSDRSNFWESEMHQLYNQLSQDFLHTNPYLLMTCLDNHDITRVFSKIKSIKRLKLALGFLLTTRGIPQLYYGTEFLYEGLENDHSSLREDVMGGWKKDKKNLFEKKGRTKKQNKIWDYLSRLLQWRKSSDAIAKGKLVHFIPIDEVYVYFRISDLQTIAIIINNNDDTTQLINFEKYKSVVENFHVGINILSDKKVDLSIPYTINPLKIHILELKKRGK